MTAHEHPLGFTCEDADDRIGDLEARVAELTTLLHRLTDAVRNWFDDVDEVESEGLHLHDLQQRIGAMFLGYGGGYNHEDDLRGALAAMAARTDRAWLDFRDRA